MAKVVRMMFVRIAHPDIEGEGRCALPTLDHWRQSGWYPLDPEHQTATEMVELRVRALQEQARLGVLGDTP